MTKAKYPKQHPLIKIPKHIQRVNSPYFIGTGKPEGFGVIVCPSAYASVRLSSTNPAQELQQETEERNKAFSHTVLITNDAIIPVSELFRESRYGSLKDARIALDDSREYQKERWVGEADSLFTKWYLHLKRKQYEQALEQYERDYDALRIMNNRGNTVRNRLDQLNQDELAQYEYITYMLETYEAQIRNIRKQEEARRAQYARQEARITTR